MNEYPDRIPQGVWMNSQMSIARHYGGINLNGVLYVIDKKNGDLVKASEFKKKKGKNP